MQWTIPEEERGVALAAALRSRAEGSWKTIKRSIRDGRVRVNGEVVKDPGLRLDAGACVEMGGAGEKKNTPQITILFEDPHLVVIEKPSGVETAPYRTRGQSQKAASRGRKRAAQTTAIDEARRRLKPGPPLGVVQRLDRASSGVLVFARTKVAEERLRAQFRVHSIERVYHCLAHGDVTSTRIETWLARDRGDGISGSTPEASPPAKRAVTHVEVIERLAGATLCRCQLETGRTHQIRIHLSEQGHPLLGERIYSRDVRRRGVTLIDSPRLMLHAVTLGFAHPMTRRQMRFESARPLAFEQQIEALRVNDPGTL